MFPGLSLLRAGDGHWTWRCYPGLAPFTKYWHCCIRYKGTKILDVSNLYSFEFSSYVLIEIVVFLLGHYIFGHKSLYAIIFFFFLQSNVVFLVAGGDGPLLHCKARPQY